MQDTFINLGRGIDGMVGRMVDRFGDSVRGGSSHTGETVELLRYVIVNTTEGSEGVLQVDETLIVDGTSGRRLEERLLAPFVTHVDRQRLRVHTRVLRRWPRRTASATPPKSVKPMPQSTVQPSPRPEAGRTPRTPRTPRQAKPAQAAAATPPAPKPKVRNADDLERRLITALAEAGVEGLSMAQLVERTGERSATLRGRLLRLGHDGSVRRAGDGLKTRYRWTDSES